MKNLNSYIRRLEKGMEDKLFFLPHLDMNEYDVIVEFGCANGRLLRRIQPVVDRTITTLVGFDKNEDILEIARFHLKWFLHQIGKMLKKYFQKNKRRV